VTFIFTLVIKIERRFRVRFNFLREIMHVLRIYRDQITVHRYEFQALSLWHLLYSRWLNCGLANSLSLQFRPIAGAIGLCFWNFLNRCLDLSRLFGLFETSFLMAICEILRIRTRRDRWHRSDRLPLQFWSQWSHSGSNFISLRFRAFHQQPYHISCDDRQR
jgi:hypothetical protein